MPKNTGRGGKNYKRGKNINETKRQLVFKEEETEYGQVTKILGNGRLEVNCFDGKKRQAHIRGSLKKKVWIQQGDVILIGLRDYQDDVCDVLHKYYPEEVRELIKHGEIPENIKCNEAENTNEIEWIADEEDGEDGEGRNRGEEIQKQPGYDLPPIDDSDEEDQEERKKDLNIDDI